MLVAGIVDGVGVDPDGAVFPIAERGADLGEQRAAGGEPDHVAPLAGGERRPAGGAGRAPSAAEGTLVADAVTLAQAGDPRGGVPMRVNNIDVERVRQTVAVVQADPAHARRTNRVEVTWQFGQRQVQMIGRATVEGRRMTLEPDSPTFLGGRGRRPGPIPYCLFGFATCARSATRQPRSA